uniref:Ubiquinone biosynthesis protein n=1 Tax=Arcella intermedia TaxID=1963864 RepID=A0A6B2LDG8_9EUKA
MEEKRKEILDNALRNVHTLGWTYEALALGASQAGLPPTAHGIITNGPIDLVHYFIDQCNIKFLSDLPELNKIPLKSRIETLIRLRLSLYVPYISRWSEALGLLAQPQNLPTSVPKLAKLIDEIWYQAGDDTTDHNWYIKRAVLTGIYTSTELYMLTDLSENHASTWEFLHRRIEDMIVLSEYQSSLEGSLLNLKKGIEGWFLAQNAQRTQQQTHDNPEPHTQPPPPQQEPDTLQEEKQKEQKV